MLQTRCARLSFCDGAPHRLLSGADTKANFAFRLSAWHDHGSPICLAWLQAHSPARQRILIHV